MFRNQPFILLFTMIFLMSCQVKKQADLIVTNAKIYSVDSEFHVYQAMAVKDQVIIELGSDSAILANYETENVQDADGMFVYPGFIDGHCHFYGYAANLYEFVDLDGTHSFEEVLERLQAQKDKPAGSWVLGRGWDQNDWPGKEYPDNARLDEMFPDNPVALTRIDGHAVLANSLALEIAGIQIGDKVDGGEIVSQNGKLTGLLIDNAADSLKTLIPELSAREEQQALAAAEKKLFAVGLTMVADAGLKSETVQLMDSMQQNGELKIRVYAMLEPNESNLRNFILNGPYQTDRLSVRSIKLYADGALGSRGALLLQPYSDDPGNYGLKINTDDFYRKWIATGFENGYQINTHCIGDSANRFILKLYGEVLGGQNDRRWRIEHAQVVEPEDLNMFAEFNIIPSIQSTHCTSDMYWAEERLGKERVKHAYAYKQLLDENGWLINGTDFPVEGISPIHTFYAAVARKDLQGFPQGGFQPENALSREEALRSITIWPAKGCFMDDVTGSLEPGKRADFIILDRDLMEVPDAHIPGAYVIKTYLDGELVYEVQ